jgi:acyl carrier protein
MERISEEELRERVDQIMVQLFELDPADLQPDKHLYQDLGLDSLDAIDLVIAFQREFKFKPENAELQEIRKVNDIYQLVLRYHDALHRAADEGRAPEPQGASASQAAEVSLKDTAGLV